MQTQKFKCTFAALCIAISLAVSGYSQSVLTNGLVAYYPFNGNAKDESGNGNDGVVYGATLATDRFGNPNQAMAFNGTNQYIQAPHQSYLNFGSGDFTISLWFNFSDDTQTYYLMGKDMGQGNYSKWIVVWGPVFHVNNPAVGGEWLAGSAWHPPAGTWHQLIFTKSGTNYTQYIDAQIESSTPGMPSLPTDNTAPLTIGQSENGNQWVNGELDDIRIYSRALSSNEVAQLFALESSPIVLNVQNVHKALYLDSSNILTGVSYQVQVSTDLINWTNYGAPFTATNSYWMSTNVWNVDNWNQLFFRLQIAP